MRYEIWQLPISNEAKFMHYDWLKKPLDIRDYVMVYSGVRTPWTYVTTAEALLEEIFDVLNVNHPADYHAASLSVSDVVCLIDTNNKREWWYVDGFGFKKLNWNI